MEPAMSLSKKPYLQSAALRPDAVVDLDRYPFTIPAIRDFVHVDFHRDVTFFVGENGSGKSTMLEALAVALGFGKDGGTRNVRIALPSDEESGLHAHLRLSKSYKKPEDSYFLRAESFFNVATYMDGMPEYLAGYGGKSLHAQSHGEAFMATLINKLRGKGLYLLDEPEAALSPSRQLAALSVIHQLVQDDSQLIIATHSPILLAYPNAKILMFTGGGIHEVAYEDTEHYAVTRDFLNHYPRRLEQLFEVE